MSNEPNQNRLFALMVMLLFWLGAWGYSFVFLATVDPTGDGFTRGLNRVSGFLGWQGVAGLFAFASWGIGRSFPKPSGIRNVSAIPLWLAVVLILVLIGMSVWGRLQA
ncbi:MAG: hypothetical protein ACSHXD_09390 [Marinosulfonomonas sp.]